MYISRIQLALVLFVLLAGDLLNAQPTDLRVKYFGVEDGLFSSNINSVVQDSTGFLWVASRDGLFRYDAYSFKAYYAEEGDSTSLASNMVNCLFVDPLGNLWIGTHEGLHLYITARDNFLRIPLEMQEEVDHSPQIQQIGIDNQGNLIVGADNKIYRSDAGKTVFNSIITLDAGQIDCFLFDRHDNIWIGCTESQGLKKYAGNGDFLGLKADKSGIELLSGITITSLLEVDGRIWITSLGEGLIIYDPVSGEIQQDYGRTWDEARQVESYIDRSGHIWTIDYTGLKMRDSLGQLQSEYYWDEEDPESILGGPTGIYQDRQGSYWVYHQWNGLGVSIKPKGFNKLSYDQRLFYNTRGLNVNSVREDKRGRLWIGRGFGGIRIYDWDNLIVEDYINDAEDPYSLGRGAVLCMFEDSRGTMWVGTYIDGLHYFDEKTKRFISFRHDPDDPHSISGNDIRSIAEDTDGNLWIAVHGKGVDFFDRKTGKFQNYSQSKNGLTNDWTFRVLFDNQERMWVGTAYGLSYLEKGEEQFVNFSKDEEDPESISDNFVSTLHLDRKGNIWAGTQNGLNRYLSESGKFERYLGSSRHSYISGILSDLEGNLWVSHRSGLLKLNLETGEKTYYAAQDGLQAENYTVGSCFRGASGLLYFGGRNGIDMFRPDDLRLNTSPPGVVIDQVRVLDKKAAIDSTGTPVSIIMNPRGSLRLSPSQFMFTISFKALNFINPERNQYQTMLEGLDLDWSDLGTNREVSFTNLEPGSYTFRVRASNNDGIWSRSDARLEIRVVPAWYETWIFRIVLVLIIIAAISVFITVRTSRLRDQASRLDRLVNEKTTELQGKTEELGHKNIELEKSNKTKDRLISIIAHDLVNPFNSLIGLSELLKEKINEMDDESRYSYAESLHSSARSAFTLLENLLTWSRSQTGRIKFSPTYIELEPLVQNVVDLNQSTIEAKGVRLVSHISERMVVWGDTDMISTIFRNLVNNAIKFVPRDGRILISAEEKEGKAIISIKDNGVGMTPETIALILGTGDIVSSPGTKGEKGSGLGLSLCTEFIRRHGGKLDIESEPGKGSTFSFLLPLKEDPALSGTEM